MSVLGAVLSLIGRIMLSLIFIYGGIWKFMDAEGVKTLLAAKGVTSYLPILVYGAGIVELFGGLALILGWKTRFAAFILAGFLVVVSVIVHNFWALEGKDMMEQMIHFFSNTAIFGGLLYVMVFGAGRISIDGSHKPV